MHAVSSAPFSGRHGDSHAHKVADRVILPLQRELCSVCDLRVLLHCDPAAHRRPRFQRFETLISSSRMPQLLTVSLGARNAHSVMLTAYFCTPSGTTKRSYLSGAFVMAPGAADHAVDVEALGPAAPTAASA